jgi:hypothetical protein
LRQQPLKEYNNNSGIVQYLMICPEAYNKKMKTRKEMKEEYKNMTFSMGVFQIKNNSNGKIFIGSSLDLKAIWHAQKFQLDIGMHRNAALQKDWKEYGSENFSYSIIETLTPVENGNVDYKKEVKVLEAMVIENLQPFDEKGYNICQHERVK